MATGIPDPPDPVDMQDFKFTALRQVPNINYG